MNIHISFTFYYTLFTTICEAYITTFLLFFSRVTKTYKELISAFPIVLSMSSLLPLLLRPSTRPFQQFLSFPSPSIKSHSLSFFRLLENIQSTKDHTLSYSQPLCCLLQYLLLRTSLSTFSLSSTPAIMN